METRIEIRPGRIINLSIHKNPKSHTSAFLIHGLGGRSAQWRMQVNFLKEHYNLIIPDLYGHGKSDKPKPNGSNPYSFKELERDLQVLFNKYSTEHNIILGHSYGGALATALANHNKEKISKLVLLTPTVCSPDIEVSKIYHLPNFMMAMLRPLIELVFKKSSFAKNASPALIAEEMQASKINPVYVICDGIRGMKTIDKVDVSKLNIPTLIVFGKYDKLIPPELPKQFYSALPQHQINMIEDAAHLIHLEQPKQVDALIKNFLSDSHHLTDSMVTCESTSAL